MRSIAVLFMLGLCGFANTSLALKQDNKNSLAIASVWARPTIGHGRVTAVYMEIKNHSADTLLLEKVESSLGHAMIHQSVIEKGMVRMRHLNGLSIPAKSSVKLEPGSYHIMITGLQKALKVGDSVDLRLSFQKAGHRDLKAKVIDKK